MADSTLPPPVCEYSSNASNQGAEMRLEEGERERERDTRMPFVRVLDDGKRWQYTLSRSQKLQTCIQIASAVLQVHANHVLHLDVKPPNFVVSDEHKQDGECVT